jgi:hypothetical protein
VADGLDIQLVVAAGLEQADQRPHLDLHAVLQAEGQELRAVAPHGAPHLGLLVLEREINMAGGGAGEGGYLTGDPHQREAFFEHIAGGPVEPGHGNDLAGLDFGRISGVFMGLDSTGIHIFAFRVQKIPLPGLTWKQLSL